MAEQNETMKVIDALGKILQDIFTPFAKKVEELDSDVRGNGKDGLKTQMAVQMNVNEQILRRLSELERKQDRGQWFAVVTLLGVVVSIAIPILTK